MVTHVLSLRRNFMMTLPLALGSHEYAGSIAVSLPAQRGRRPLAVTARSTRPSPCPSPPTTNASHTLPACRAESIAPMCHETACEACVACVSLACQRRVPARPTAPARRCPWLPPPPDMLAGSSSKLAHPNPSENALLPFETSARNRQCRRGTLSVGATGHACSCACAAAASHLGQQRRPPRFPQSS